MEETISASSPAQRTEPFSGSATVADEQRREQDTSPRRMRRRGRRRETGLKGASGRRLPPSLLLLACTLPALGLVLLAVTHAQLRGFGLTDALTDPAQSFGYSGRWGAVSQLGVMTWAAAAGIALHAAGDLRLPPALRRWLLRAGVVTVVMAVDDGLMLHERLGERVPGGELLVLGALALAVLILLVPSLRVVLRHPYRVVVVVAVVLLGGSVVVDASELRLVNLLGVSQTVPIIIEETFKFLGIAAWLGAVVALARPASDRT